MLCGSQLREEFAGPRQNSAYESVAFAHYDRSRSRPVHSHSGLDFLAVASAHLDACSGFEKNLILPVFMKLETPHFFEIYNAGTMHSAKQARIQFAIEIRQAATQQMASWSHMQAGVIVGGFDPVDIARPDK